MKITLNVDQKEKLLGVTEFRLLKKKKNILFLYPDLVKLALQVNGKNFCCSS